MIAPKWVTGAGFLGTYTERITTSTFVIADGSLVTYQVISGALPGGMRERRRDGWVAMWWLRCEDAWQRAAVLACSLTMES